MCLPFKLLPQDKFAAVRLPGQKRAAITGDTGVLLRKRAVPVSTVDYKLLKSA